MPTIADRAFGGPARDRPLTKAFTPGERRLALRATTPDAITRQLTTDGQLANANNVIRIPENVVVFIEYTVIAIQRSSTIVSPAWAPSTPYVVSDMVVNGGRRYVCTVAGTSAASGGPTGAVVGTNVVDGTAQWQFMGYPPGMAYKVTSTVRMAASGNVQQVTPGAFEAISRDASTQGPGARAWGMSVFLQNTWDAASLNVRGEAGKTVDWYARADIFQAKDLG
jgi:hypothetical protein